ncbi:MAG: restriction endonuclease [Betaproteobacteria bacterium]|nr:restriction endonuclease [Betaproteobacteria bacterium]
MARRNRKHSPGWLDLFSLLPWWLCLVFAVASYLLLHGFAGTRPDPRGFGAQPAQFVVGSWLRGLALFGQYFLPFAFAIAAIISGSRSFKSRGLVHDDREDPAWGSRPLDPIAPDRDLYADWKDGGRFEPAEAAIDTSRWSLELLKALDWKRFELVCAGYFEELGFRAETTKAGPDGGVDIHLFTKDSRHPAIVVQCKAWRNVPVGVGPVREMLGVMTAASVKEGIVATVGAFTSEARAFALGKEIHLIDGEDFLAKLRNLAPERQQSLLAFATEGDFTTPTCPSCGIGHRMKLRTSGKDGARFWGCGNFPRCRATMPLARS